MFPTLLHMWCPGRAGHALSGFDLLGGLDHYPGQCGVGGGLGSFYVIGKRITQALFKGPQ